MKRPYLARPLCQFFFNYLPDQNPWMHGWPSSPERRITIAAESDRPSRKIPQTSLQPKPKRAAARQLARACGGGERARVGVAAMDAAAATAGRRQPLARHDAAATSLSSSTYVRTYVAASTKRLLLRRWLGTVPSERLEKKKESWALMLAPVSVVMRCLGLAGCCCCGQCGAQSAVRAAKIRWCIQIVKPTGNNAQAGRANQQRNPPIFLSGGACLPARAGIMDGWYILDPERQQIIRAMTAGEGDAGRGRRDGEAGGGAPRARASCSRLAIASACVSAWHPPPPASVRARLGLRALMLPA